MNAPRVYYSDQRLNGEQNLQGTISHFQTEFKKFILQFTHQQVKKYCQQITTMINNRKFYIILDLEDLKNANQNLYEQFAQNPLELLKIMEDSLKDLIKQHQKEFPVCRERETWQILVRSDDSPRKLRDITSKQVMKLFVIQGIIISTTKPYIKASKLKIKCKSCENVKIINLGPGQNPYIPSFCTGGNNSNTKCTNDPFVAMPDSQVIDTQSWKIQQNPEQIPTGQIARTYNLIVDRYNVGKCVPGDRVRITGIMVINDSKQSISRGCIYVTGLQKLKERTSIQYSSQQEQIFKKMSKDPNLYQKIQKSIAPGIFGNPQIKKAIACMLFGGSRKHLPDNTILRGDINILLIGDPSTAKSQFLKFVEQTASIAVYTSGKGSSAAGLTASITKDSTTGQFQIEGGALVLADGGIVCIDQFDKMRPDDRVAIHEAMEQQTISIAKAGITTRLNSRTSILAAANPIHGRYSINQSISDQMQLQKTILSRFDCIFVVRDINTNQNNERIASHVLGLHQGKILQKNQDASIPFSILKKYISYARNKCKPRITPKASQKLQDIYVNDRQIARQHKLSNPNTMPITVRQLEAIIRLSESLAKMKLRTEVTTQDVDEAHYLFEISTMKTLQGKQFGIEIAQNVVGQVLKIQELIKKRLPIGNQASVTEMINRLQEKASEQIIKMAIHNMIKNSELKQIRGNQYIFRQK